MNSSPFKNNKSLRGTVLFVDNEVAESISLTGGMSSLVPSEYVMISSIEIQPNEIQELIQRLMGIITFEHFEIFISSVIEKYISQIKVLAGFVEFDITKITTTCFSDSYPSLPDNLLGRIVFSPGFLFAVSDYVSIFTTIKVNIQEQIYRIDSAITQRTCSLIKKFIGSARVKCFRVGDYAADIAEIIEKNAPREASSALLIIDRTCFAAPLFIDTNSILDLTASKNIFHTLMDREFLDAEIKGGQNALKELIQGIIGAEEATLNSCIEAWNKLPNQDRENLSTKHPTLKLIFDDIGFINKRQFQEMLFNGENIEDVICNASFGDSLAFIALKKLFSHSIDIETLITDLYKSNEEKAKYYCTAPVATDIITDCRSSYDRKSGVSIKSLITLPTFISSVLDPQIPEDSRIKSPGGSFLSGFFSRSKPPSIKSFRSLYIYIIGGISFAEVEELQKIISNSKSGITTRIASDTICSAVNLFTKK